MKGFLIYLAEACGNTFILVDCLSRQSLNEEEINAIHQILVHENRDDAMILINGQPEGDTLSFEMLVLGLDKTLGDFCGNGSRATAAFVYSHYPQYQHFVIRTPKDGRPLHHYGDSIYSIHLPKVNFIPDNRFVSDLHAFSHVDGFYRFEFQNRAFYYADAIEPHLILVEDLSTEALHDLGQRLNQLKILFPRGMNITVYHEVAKNQLQAETYERGVQRPTASCGTGASCAASFYLHGLPGRVKVDNPGGTLELVNHPESLELIGPACVTGRVE